MDQRRLAFIRAAFRYRVARWLKACSRPTPLPLRTARVFWNAAAYEAHLAVMNGEL